MTDTPKHDDMEVRHAAAAGLDVHKMQVTATVRTHAGREVPLVETPASSVRWRAASPFWCSGCPACG